jgi:superfamily II DNA or RNA helicase
MLKLEDLTVGAQVKGIRPEGPVSVVAVKWLGTTAVELTYKDAAGQVAAELLFRDREASLEVVSAGRAWNFDGDGDLFRLVSEAFRIKLAYLFDPLLAVHTALVEPLPHQILAVYESMLTRQPLRFLLADDPGAGKTIMAGLLIKELIARGDLRRCLIICPGALAEQWQDELAEKFQVPFEILTNDKIESAHSGNWLKENNLVIARLDKLSRDEDLQVKLSQTDWDLVVVDEAHKMSASHFGREIKETKRYKLGRLVGGLTRHLLLMTATPHNGKEEDFQLFMALLDEDRFEGKFRDGVHVIDASDMMRRLVKEQILKFDGTPLFPERRAYTANYQLSDAEAHLYKEVTDYVRDEFNRADSLGEGRRGTVGFALTVLQRRLASSPEAIYQSLRRRKERLEKRLREEELVRRGAEAPIDPLKDLPELDDDALEDLDDATDSEIEATEEKIVDQATAARTVAELRAEIAILERLEALAFKVRHSGTDRKWDELSSLLQNQGEMFDLNGHRRKLVIFTEHRDTLNYLSDRIGRLLGRPEALVIIHGSLGRDERRKAQELFTQNKAVEILVATDAAGEGINLQRAHLMVNYDLPWNPNRIEQRFGRIHRIGQTEVCHLWNLVAEETREGDVFKRLFEKIEEERRALGNGVFDILGKLFQNRPLRELLIEAVRYGDRPDIRARLHLAVDNLADRERCRELLEDRALAHDSMDVTRVHEIREEMERAEARRLQPHFIASFFLEAFKRLGGSAKQREPKRYEISHVPPGIRARDREIGRAVPVLDRYERITFEKSLITVPGQPLASFVCPGHPLLDASLDIILERHRGLLKQGAILVNPNDPGTEARVLFYLDHAISDARTDAVGARRVISRQVHFVETGRNGTTLSAGYAPYLDYRPLTAEEEPVARKIATDTWLREDLESGVMEYAVTRIVPAHLDSVRARREALIEETREAVKERLTKEINYWDHRAEELRAQEQAGRTPRLNSSKARQRADELQVRLQRRMGELEREKHISALPPVVVGGALIIPGGLLARLRGEAEDPELVDRARVEMLAMNAVIEAERVLGYEPRDVSKENLGYDVESRVPGTGKLRFIEVKGRRADATTVCVTRNEILTGFNLPDDFVLAVVPVDRDTASPPLYIRRPFQKEPDFGVSSANYDLKDLIARGEAPA